MTEVKQEERNPGQSINDKIIYTMFVWKNKLILITNLLKEKQKILNTKKSPSYCLFSLSLTRFFVFFFFGKESVSLYISF